MQLLVRRLSVALLVKCALERGLMDRSSSTTAVCYVAHSPSSLPVVTAVNALVCIYYYLRLIHYRLSHSHNDSTCLWQMQLILKFLNLGETSVVKCACLVVPQSFGGAHVHAPSAAVIWLHLERGSL